MSVDTATVAHIAHLARIAVDEEKLEALAGDMRHILDWIEQLGEVNTDDVPPMASVADMTLRWREDTVTEGGNAEAILANAPEADHGFFVVPKVVE